MSDPLNHLARWAMVGNLNDRHMDAVPDGDYVRLIDVRAALRAESGSVGLDMEAVRTALGRLYPWQSGPTNAKDAARFAALYAESGEQAMSDTTIGPEMHGTIGFPGFDHFAGSEPEACELCREGVTMSVRIIEAESGSVGLDMEAVRTALGRLYPWQSGPTNAKDAARFAALYAESGSKP